MGAKDSKRSCLSYEDAVKRSKYNKMYRVLCIHHVINLDEVKT